MLVPNQKLQSLTRTSIALLTLLGLAACSGGSSTPPDPNVSNDPEISDQTQADMIVRVSQDLTVMVGEQFPVSAVLILQSTPSDLPILEWQVLDINADVVLENADRTRASAVFNAEGEYEVQFFAKVGDLEGNDTLTVTVIDPIINQAPQVNAGNSVTIEFDETIQLNAVVSDDGLPASSLVTQWSFSSNDGNATFNETSEVDTQVSFDLAGEYTLTLTADDGELSAKDSLTIIVQEPVVIVDDPGADPSGNSGGISANKTWKNVTTANGSKPQARHEAGAVAFNGDMYLLSGRGKRKVNRYDPNHNKWTTEGASTTDFSHFQPVVYGSKIYAVGGLTCCYPSESVLTHVQIFNPSSKTWSQGHRIPANRRRGGGGVVNYKNKIYMVGGNTNGHDGGTVNWFDEYNPATNTWKTLKSAPNKRDHVNAVVVGDKLVVAGGRKTDHPNVFNDLVSDTDVYNFKTGKWETNHPDIPTPTAGAMAVQVGNEAVVIGGEVGSSSAALNVVQAYNVVSRKWRTLKPLNTGRHSGGAVVVGNAIHVVSGNTTIGGGNETQSHEKLEFN
ncbi:MAG: kelch repeat-containing protein [Granulosicoccaceae bacterium]